jgi:hypothetical protein
MLEIPPLQTCIWGHPVEKFCRHWLTLGLVSVRDFVSSKMSVVFPFPTAKHHMHPQSSRQPSRGPSPSLRSVPKPILEILLHVGYVGGLAQAIRCGRLGPVEPTLFDISTKTFTSNSPDQLGNIQKFPPPSPVPIVIWCSSEEPRKSVLTSR